MKTLAVILSLLFMLGLVIGLVRSRQLLKKETFILNILSSYRCYGMGMVKASNGLLSRGGIYLILDSMENRGLISSVLEEKEYRGYRRRIYTIEPKGKDALAAAKVKV